MAPVLENSASFGTSGSGFFPLTLPFTPTVGRKLLLAISQYETSLITLIITPGVVWTKIQDRSQAPGSLGVNTEHWIGDVVGPSPGTGLDVFRSGGFTDAAIAVHEVSGLREIWPVDQLADAVGSTTPAQTGQSGLPFRPESYFFGSVAGADSSGTTVPGSPTNGFSKREEDIGPNGDTTRGHRITTIDKIVSAAENATSSMTYSGFTRWVGLMSTLRGANEVAKPIQRVAGSQKQGDLSGASTVVTPAVQPSTGDTLLLATFISDAFEVTAVAQTGVDWVKDVEVDLASGHLSIWRGHVRIESAGSITITASGAPSGGYILEGFEGILDQVLTQTPLDQTVSANGTGPTIATGLTAAIDGSDELLFGAIGAVNSLADMQEAPGYLRAVQGLFGGTIVGATFVNDESFRALQYELQADSAASGVWMAALATYRNALPATTEGPTVGMWAAELNQGGTASPVTSGSFSDFAEIPAGTFTDGHRHLILAAARVQNPNGLTSVQLRVGSGSSDLASFRPYAPSLSTRGNPWNVCRLATLSSSDSVAVQLRHVSGNTGEVRQINLVVIDLDSINLFEGRDWFHEENSAVIADMDTTFANNVGATMRIRPDGASSYVVIGHGRLSCMATTPITNELCMRLRDVTNAETLAQAGWHKAITSAVDTQAFNVMTIFDSPPASDLDLAIEMIGGGPGAPTTPGWQHEESSITVIRLEAFYSSGFDQDRALNQASPGDIMPPTAGSVSAQAQFGYGPDATGEVLTLAYAEADNVANDAAGIASQAQFPGMARSLWDTEDTTLGNTVVQTAEVMAGHYATNNAETRIPTWGVSLRTGLSGQPGTAQWFNGGGGGSPIIKRVALALLGRSAAPTPEQSPAPTPVAVPTPTTVLTEKPDGQHEEEALDHQLEQFKPGIL